MAVGESSLAWGLVPAFCLTAFMVLLTSVCPMDTPSCSSYTCGTLICWVPVLHLSLSPLFGFLIWSLCPLKRSWIPAVVGVEAVQISLGIGSYFLAYAMNVFPGIGGAIFGGLEYGIFLSPLLGFPWLWSTRRKPRQRKRATRAAFALTRVCLSYVMLYFLCLGYTFGIRLATSSWQKMASFVLFTSATGVLRFVTAASKLLRLAGIEGPVKMWMEFVAELYLHFLFPTFHSVAVFAVLVLVRLVYFVFAGYSELRGGASWAARAVGRHASRGVSAAKSRARALSGADNLSLHRLPQLDAGMLEERLLSPEYEQAASHHQRLPGDADGEEEALRPVLAHNLSSLVLSQPNTPPPATAALSRSTVATPVPAHALASLCDPTVAGTYTPPPLAPFSVEGGDSGGEARASMSESTWDWWRQAGQANAAHDDSDASSLGSACDSDSDYDVTDDDVTDESGSGSSSEDEGEQEGLRRSPRQSKAGGRRSSTAAAAAAAAASASGKKEVHALDVAAALWAKHNNDRGVVSHAVAAGELDQDAFVRVFYHLSAQILASYTFIGWVLLTRYGKNRLAFPTYLMSAEQLEVSVGYACVTFSLYTLLGLALNIAIRRRFRVRFLELGLRSVSTHVWLVSTLLTAALGLLSIFHLFVCGISDASNACTSCNTTATGGV